MVYQRPGPAYIWRLIVHEGISMPSRRLFLPLLLVLTGISALAGALISQYWGGLQPCILCLYQRWPHGLAAGLGLLALLPVPSGQARWLLILGSLTLLAGAAIALFHVGVEYHWWAGTASCGNPIAQPQSIEDLRQALLAAPVVRCDVPAWSLFGISMAGYNLLLSLLVGGVVLAGALKGSKQI